MQKTNKTTGNACIVNLEAFHMFNKPEVPIPKLFFTQKKKEIPPKKK